MSRDSSGTAVVLGAGGVVGTAWMLGLASGLRRHGVDLAAAELIVGTSAGAIVGAMVATGRELDKLAVAPPAVEVHDERTQLARMGALIGTSQWPDRRLLITSVDESTRARVVWDRSSGVPLPTAVAASMAFPGAFPAITVAGRRHLDGGLASGTNVDLAAGMSTVIVLQPLAHLFGDAQVGGELATVAPRDAYIVRPDAATITAFGADLHDRSAWPACYANGVRMSAILESEFSLLGNGIEVRDDDE